jgi:GT2 family glycosyltransferase
MNLSVIIVNWNTKPLLLECLRTVRNNRLDSALQTEVLIVDNASTDGSADAVREAFPEAKVIVNTRNLGFSGGNNVGLKFTTGEFCLLLNSDTLIPDGVFNKLIGVMNSNSKTAVCGPSLQNVDGSVQLSWAKFPDTRSELTGRLDRSQSPYPLLDFEEESLRATMQPFPVDWVGGAFFLVRRQAIDQVGLLDEGFFMFGEETEWCHRFAKHGWQTLLVPGVTVTHLGGQSTKAVAVETRRQMYRSSIRLYGILYGRIGALLPTAIATVRFLLSPLRRDKRRRGATEPVQ